MVLDRSYLTVSDLAQALVQITVQDLIVLVASAPTVILLLGHSNTGVSQDVLLYFDRTGGGGKGQSISAGFFPRWKF